MAHTILLQQLPWSCISLLSARSQEHSSLLPSCCLGHVEAPQPESYARVYILLLLLSSTTATHYDALGQLLISLQPFHTSTTGNNLYFPKKLLFPPPGLFYLLLKLLHHQIIVCFIWDHHDYNVPKKCKNHNFWFPIYTYGNIEASAVVQVRAPQALGLNCWIPIPLETGLANKRDTLFLMSQSQTS